VATLIVYQSNFTYTQTVAEVLDGLLLDQSVVRPWRASALPNLSLYDTVVVGGSIRYGQIQPELRGWLEATADELAGMPHALFLACGFPENFEEYLTKNIPAAFRESSLVNECVGGMLNFDKMGFLNRSVARIMKRTILKRGGQLPEQRPEAIEHLAEVLNARFEEAAGSAASTNPTPTAVAATASVEMAATASGT
jgi:menaquinone-dependent protoporphyrinogen oxidase